MMANREKNVADEANINVPKSTILGRQDSNEF